MFHPAIDNMSFANTAPQRILAAAHFRDHAPGDRPVLDQTLELITGQGGEQLALFISYNFV